MMVACETVVAMEMLRNTEISEEFLKEDLKEFTDRLHMGSRITPKVSGSPNERIGVTFTKMGRTVGRTGCCWW